MFPYRSKEILKELKLLVKKIGGYDQLQEMTGFTEVQNDLGQLQMTLQCV